MAELVGPPCEDGEYEWLSAAEAASTWTLHRQSARAASACVRREREFHQCRCAALPVLRLFRRHPSNTLRIHRAAAALLLLLWGLRRMTTGFPGSQHCIAGALVRIEYGTTNQATAKGLSVRCVTLDRRGTVSETTYGKADDLSPGWWVRERAGEAVLKKFFLDRRIRAVWQCSSTRLARLDIVDHRVYQAEQHAGPDEPAAQSGTGDRTDRSSSSGGQPTRKREPTRELHSGAAALKRAWRGGESN